MMVDDTSHADSTPDNGKESEPSNNNIKRIRSKCSSSKDTSNDVLYAKGAAAQTITNPGNLYFYQLCEARYDEYTKIDASSDPDGKRRTITKEIVDAVIANGGVFRTSGGGKLKYNQAIDKTRDRLRQIGKPKLRPIGFGEHDVVSVMGARVHLYPGNAKWHALVDGYVLSYFRDIVDADTGLYNEDKDQPRKPIKFPKGKGGRFKKGSTNRPRPAYQNDIANEIISTIHERGGKFCDEGLREFSQKEAANKIHNRFKDLKRELISGKRDFKLLDNNTDAAKKKVGECVPDIAVSSSTVASKTTTALSGAEIFRQRLGGFSAVKATVSSIGELRAYKRRERASRRKERASTPKKKRCRQSYDDDDDSFHSAMLRYDGKEDDSDDEEDEVEDETNSDSDSSDMEAKKVKKEKAANDRAERAKRRRSGLAAPTPPKSVEKKKVKKRRRSTYEKEEEEEVAPDPPLSEYELYRLEKIQRNQAKLRQLGL